MAEAQAAPPIPNPRRWLPTGPISPATKKLVGASVLGIVVLALVFGGGGSQQTVVVAPKPKTVKDQPVSPRNVQELTASIQQDVDRMRQQVQQKEQQVKDVQLANQQTLADLNHQADLAQQQYGAQQAAQAQMGGYRGGSYGGTAGVVNSVDHKDKSLFAPIIVQNELKADTDAPAQATEGPAAGNGPQAPARDAGVVPAHAKSAALDYDQSWQTVVLPEGFVVEMVLVNKLEGSNVGPVECMVATPAYEPGTRNMILPQGADVLGEASAVSNLGQQRLAVAFHRIIVHGSRLYSIPLDKEMPALDQQGATALHDQVNSHYAAIFGASLAVGAIGGLANIGNSFGGIGINPMAQFRTGVAQGTSSSAEQILSRFLNRMPTLTIRPGTRVRLMLTGDLTVPLYHE